MKKLLLVLCVLVFTGISEAAIFTGDVLFTSANGLVLEAGDTGRYSFNYLPQKQTIVHEDADNIFYQLIGSDIDFQADTKPLSFSANNLEMRVSKIGFGIAFMDPAPNIVGAPVGTIYDDLFISLPDAMVNQGVFEGVSGRVSFGSAIYNLDTFEEYTLEGTLTPDNATDPVPEPATIFLTGLGLLGFFKRRKIC